MLYLYKLREDEVYDEESVVHTAWGVTVSDAHGEVLRSIGDVFLDKKRAEAFVEKCNKSQLSPIHLLDVIEDVLAE